MSSSIQPAIWFPTIKAGSGTDTFTERLVRGLNRHGLKAEIAWLSHRAEYFPWIVKVPKTPDWVNVVHINSWLPTRFLPANIPIVATIHHSTYDPAIRKYKGLLQKIYHELWMGGFEGRNLPTADSVVAVSNFAADIARERFGLNGIDVIHNGIATRGVPFRSHPIHSLPFRLGYVGSWRVLKGVDLLPKIMMKLGPDFELMCIGGTPSEVERRNCPANMVWINRIDDQAKLYSLLLDCDALLFPSRSEGLSLVLLEAQACGLPVIAADNSSIPEIVIHEKTGLLCRPDNVGDFVRSIRRLAEDPELGTSLGKAARERVSQCFSEDVQIERYVECYKKVLQSKDHRAAPIK